jgi:general secretion pathway protein D
VVNYCRRVGACVAAGLAAASLAGCDLTSLSEPRPKLPDPFDQVQNTNLDPRYPQQMQQETAPPRAAPGHSFFGRETAVDPVPPAAAAGAQQSASGEGYELNFENAAVTTVAKVILGDILGVGYIIDPRVQGTVTISSGRPIPKSVLILVLENALRMSNVALVADGGGGYRLIPAGDAQGAGPTTRAGADEQGGYGISAVPLRYTSAQTILKLLDSFAIKPGMARADTAHNLILVQGSGTERQTAVEAILTFDVDWMRGQSVGIYPVVQATAEAVIKELEKIMETGEGGLNHDLVTLQPIARLNAVLVVTKKPNLLRQAATWISRLDQANNAGASVRVYRLRYADARQVAKVLGDLFGSRSQGLDSAVNQIAPGGGVNTLSSDQLTSSGAASSPFTLNAPSGSGQSTGGGVGGTGGGLGSTGSPLGSSPQGLGSSSIGSSGGLGGSTSSGLGGQLGAAGGQGQGLGFGLGQAQGQGQVGINLPGLRVAADVANNSLLIFANQENYRLIEQTLAQIDRPQLQVAIHATIAEVTLNNDLQYGVQYYIQGNSAAFGFTTSTTQSNPLNPVLPGANLLLGPPGGPRVVLNALRTITDVKVLSSPSLVVLDNEIASLQVGDQVPVSTGSAAILTNPTTPLVNTISYLNTGVILQVLPRINANGNVNLEIQQEISNVANNANATTLTPTVSQRKVKSSVSVASGQTVLLGGLITETQNRSRNGIPILEEIPLLGQLASTNDRSTQRTELIIFIEPQIIRDSVDASKVAQELRARLRGSAEIAFPPGPALRSDPRFAQ